MISSLKNLLAEIKTNCGAFDNSSLKLIAANANALRMKFEIQTFPTQGKPLFQERGKSVWQPFD